MAILVKHRKMENIKNVEFRGYGVIADIFHEIHRKISKFSGKFASISEKMRFQQYKMVFGERDDDIYIVTYPKSGTTMMQVILYQLTTKGKMDFNHIYDVSPWIRNASFRKQAPVNLPSPRIIKSHDHYKQFPQSTKGKFIYVYRDGMDTAISLYHQQKNYNNSELKFDDFLKKFHKSKAWFKHTKAWFKNKKKFPVLYVKYENLLKDKHAEIQRIISFCNINAKEEAIERAVKFSSFEYMKKHEALFGDRPKETKKVYDQFIRKGKTGEGDKQFSEEQKATFIKYYQKFVKRAEEKILDENF